MSDATGIEWTDTTWNPVRGCSKVSAGCTNCYAERTAARQAHSGYKGLVTIGNGSPRWTGEVRLVPEKLDEPLRWRKPRRVFVNSMSDLFHEKLTDDDIARVFAPMALAPKHTFQILTKRPKRMRHWFIGQHRPNIAVYDAAASMLPGEPGDRDWSQMPLDMAKTRSSGGSWWPLPNVWLGVSIENQAAADERIPLLLATPAALRFLSVEPLLGAVDLERVAGIGDVLCGVDHVDQRLIDWVIVGGESGPGARPCDVAWIRSVVEQCKAAGVPCFVKQLGAYVLAPPDDRLYAFGADGGGLTRFASKKGGDMEEWPLDLRVRQLPEVRP